MKTRLLAAMLLLPLPALAEKPPGHPSVGKAQDMLAIPKGALRQNVGRVVESMDSNDYVYIQVATDSGMQWLVAPRMTVPANALVRWGGGTEMRDFYSRKHHRLFDRVLFVDGLDVVPAKPASSRP